MKADDTQNDPLGSKGLSSRTSEGKINNLMKRIEEISAGSQGDLQSPEMVQALNDLAYALHRSDSETSEEYARKALGIARELGFKKGEAESSSILGTIHLVRGNYRQAQKDYSSSLEICEEIKDKKGLASCYNNLGITAKNRGKYEEALKYKLKALDIKTTVGDKMGLAKSHNNIGILYDELNDPDHALKHYKKALGLFEDVGDKTGVAFSYNNIGVVYETKGNLHKALECYLRSLQIKEEIEDRKGIADSYLNMGGIHEIREDYKNARDFFTKALNIFEQLGDKRELADTLISLGCIDMKLGEYDRACKFLQKGRRIANQIMAKNKEIEGCEHLSELYEIKGDFKTSLWYLKRFIEIKDEIFNERNAENIARLRIQFEVEASDKEAEILRGKNEELESEIAKREVVENALKESEERYRNLIENSPAGIAIHRKGKVAYANPAILRMLGYDSADTVVGKPVKDFVHPKYREFERRNIREVEAREGKPGDLNETQLLCKDGTAIDVVEIAQRITYKDEPAIQVYLLNNTERKRAERKLRELQGDLERQVREQTAELLDKNEELWKEITERKIAEEELRGSEKKHRLLLESITSPVLAL
ncbi:tetratricopeptide repeat protein, partial [candidate division WOR-3 bacterium]|nr:tetratricopeptide repeat protein [candidate division WOR-3 bacterium]MBD3365704.1 tetratricopeptide repeat protein [candidate division WOR-3 bacterium]